MRTPAICADQTITIKEAAEKMMKDGVGCLPIVDSMGIIQGMVTRTDLIKTIKLPISRL
jgi:CBS domain-containing protein